MEIETLRDVLPVRTEGSPCPQERSPKPVPKGQAGARGELPRESPAGERLKECLLGGL